MPHTNAPNSNSLASLACVMVTTARCPSSGRQSHLRPVALHLASFQGKSHTHNLLMAWHAFSSLTMCLPDACISRSRSCEQRAPHRVISQHPLVVAWYVHQGILVDGCTPQLMKKRAASTGSQNLGTLTRYGQGAASMKISSPLVHTITEALPHAVGSTASNGQTFAWSDTTYHATVTVAPQGFEYL